MGSMETWKSLRIPRTNRKDPTNDIKIDGDWGYTYNGKGRVKSVYKIWSQIKHLYAGGIPHLWLAEFTFRSVAIKIFSNLIIPLYIIKLFQWWIGYSAPEWLISALITSGMRGSKSWVQKFGNDLWRYGTLSFSLRFKLSWQWKIHIKRQKGILFPNKW